MSPAPPFLLIDIPQYLIPSRLVPLPFPPATLKVPRLGFTPFSRLDSSLGFVFGESLGVR